MWRQYWRGWVHDYVARNVDAVWTEVDSYQLAPEVFEAHRPNLVLPLQRCLKLSLDLDFIRLRRAAGKDS